MAYDAICKSLVESFAADFASWLLGKPINLTELQPSELSLEPIRADSLMLLQSEDLILHIEFQTKPKDNVPFRMADYRLRCYRKLPTKEMRQVVIYLTPTTSELVYQTAFEIPPRTRHEFDVIRLWEQPTDIFLNSPGLLPLAMLADTSDRVETLKQVAAKIRLLPESDQSRVASSASFLAGLLLKDDVLIKKVMGQSIIEESSVYQGAVAKGIETGRQELILELLARKLGGLSEAVEKQVRGLQSNQLNVLGYDLLSFDSSMADLTAWLEASGRE